MADWPDSNNTGVPAGVTLRPSGGITINTPGTVISGLEINGPVYVNANNVTIENCKITNGNYSVVTIQKGLTGVVVQDCELDGQNDAGFGIGGQGTFLRNNIYNVSDGINVQGSNVVIQDNYIHDLFLKSGAHYDGIQMDGGFSNVLVEHNTIINPNGQTSAIMIDGYWGDISNITVNNNLLAGGGYTIYATGVGVVGDVTGIKVTNNHFGAGQYGTTIFEQAQVTASGNTNDGWDLVAGLNDSSAPSPLPPPPPVVPPGATDGADNLTGDSGNNTIDAMGGNDRVDGGAGNDTLSGGSGDDTLLGGAGSDKLIGGAGRDVMTGGTENDVFVFQSTTDSTTSSPDTITDFTRGQDKIDLSALDANSSLTGNQDFSFLAANGAAFTGKAGELTWRTDASTNKTMVQGDVNGDGKADFAVQLNGQINLAASDFTGLASASSPPPPPPTTSTATTISGTSGADTLIGGDNANTIRGYAGNDVLKGNGGNDVLIGGAGKDTMSGGAGIDKFMFGSAGDIGKTVSTRDVITDFTHGVDKIDLSVLDANSYLTGNQAFSFLATNGTDFTHKAGQLAWWTDAGTNTTIVQGDTNGDGIHDFEIQLNGQLTLSQGDFIL